MTLFDPLNRRKLLKHALLGGIGSAFAIEQLGGVPLLGTLTDHLYRGRPFLNRLDSFDMIRDALAGGPSALRVAAAMASADSAEWAIVDIRIVNHVSTPLVFALGKINADNTLNHTGFKPSTKVKLAKPYLEAAGLEKASDDPRMKALRFNKWFADMLINGTSDGAAPATDSANLLGLDKSDVINFNDPEVKDKVSLQTYLGVDQNEENLHQLRGLKLRKELGDIGFFIQKSELIYSPLGITCFMMGEKYDKANGDLAANAVLSGDGAETGVVESRAVADYVDQIKQYTGTSYADRASIEQNVVYRMDKLVDKDPLLRKELVNSISNFSSGLGQLRAAADLENRFQTANPATGNRQSSNTTTDEAAAGASSEFLGQCKYVAKSLTLRGMPLRNFSLFLNMIDIDTESFDFAANNGATGLGGDCKALTYVEGMRQLAIGLNVLAAAIASGKNIMVFVHSEGGRSEANGDDHTQFCMVMGPKGAGLADACHFNNAMVDATASPHLTNPGGKDTVAPWDTDGGEILGPDGSKVAGAKPTIGDIGMGIVEFLDEKLGKQVLKAQKAGQNNYVKLKRV